MKHFIAISIVFHTVLFAALSLFPSQFGGNKNARTIEISFYEGKGYRPVKAQKVIVKPADIFPIIKPDVLEKKTEEKLMEPESIIEAPALEKKESTGPVSGPAESEAGYGTGVSNSDPEITAWFSSVKERVERYKRYPKKALDEGNEGKVILEITVESSGILNKVNVFYSSGSHVLDDEAVRTVKISSPFRPCPAKLGKSVTFRLPLKFEVTR